MAYSEVWWNGPEGFVKDRATRLPSSGPHGMTSVEPGNIADRGPEEYYTSEAHELPDGAGVTRVSWEAELGPRTWVKAQLRTAQTEEGLESAPWTGPDGEDSWYEAPQDVAGERRARWVQYRVALGAFNAGSTPRVTQVDVAYDMR